MGVYRTLVGHGLSIAVKITHLAYFHFDNAIAIDVVDSQSDYPICILFHPAALAATISSRGSSPTRRS
jgi:hypothetical protein